MSLPNDADRREIGDSQLALWKANFGKAFDGVTSAAVTASRTVPEATGVSLAALGLGLVGGTRARG